MDRKSRMSSPMLTRIIDRACGPLTERIERSRMPSRMLLHPATFACIEALREREVVDGYPLMFLGIELCASTTVALEGFEFED